MNNQPLVDSFAKNRLTDRELLLQAARWFAVRASQLPGIKQIALIGSLCTAKKNPKDLDLLVTVAAKAELSSLAKLGRQAQGQVERGSLGVDVLLVEDGKYLGRCCTFREPHLRVRCAPNLCDCDRRYLCRTSFILNRGVIDNPSLVIWPEFQCRGEIPDDVRMTFAD